MTSGGHLTRVAAEARFPKPLPPGGCIGFIAPSSALPDSALERFEAGRARLETLGFRTKVADQVYSKDVYGLSAGEPAARAEALNTMFRDPEVDAIWCARGGDTANQILHLIDFGAIGAGKPFIGFSDNSQLLNAILTRTGLVTFHGPGPMVGRPAAEFDSPFTEKEFLRCIVHGGREKVPAYQARQTVRAGQAEGPLVGGNIQCFLKLVGTPYLPSLNGAVLLFEGMRMTVAEAVTRLMQYKHAGVFDSIAGVLVGEVMCFDREENLDTHGERITFERILRELTEPLRFPIMKFFEAGHDWPGSFLPIGGTVRFDTESGSLTVL